MLGTERTTVLRPMRPSLPSIDSSVDASSTSGLSSRLLPARYEAVRDSREFTKTTLRKWGVAEGVDDVVLVVSELVTNALRHGCFPEDLSVRLESPLRLHLMRWTSRLVCAVRDPSDAAPVARMLCPSGSDFAAELCTDSMNAESGRGLHLVDSFSDSWGWQPVSGRPGKVVWAVFQLGAGSCDRRG